MRYLTFLIFLAILGMPADAQVPTDIPMVGSPLAIGNLNLYVTSAQWHPSGEIVAVGTTNGVYILNTQLHVVQILFSGQSNSYISGLSWKPDGTQLAIGNATNVLIWQWNHSIRQASYLSTIPQTAIVIGVFWSPTNNYLAVARFKEPFDTYNTVHLADVSFWNPTNWALVSTSVDSYVVVDDTVKDNVLSWDSSGTALYGVGQYVSVSNNTVAYASEIVIFGFSPSTGAVTSTIPVIGGITYSIAVQPSGNYIAVGTDGGVSIYDKSTSIFVKAFPASIDVMSLGWSPNGQYLVADGTLIDINTQKIMTLFGTASVFTSDFSRWSSKYQLLSLNISGELQLSNVSIVPNFNTSLVQPTSVPLPTVTPTTSITPTPAVTCNTTVASGNNAALITAIQSGNSAGSPYVVCLGNGTFTLTASNNTLDGGNGLPQITGNVTLYGTGAVIERQSAAPAFRLFRVNAGGRLKLEGVTVRGGAAGTSSGGGVRNLGTLELVNAIIENNTAANGAGIINNVNATLTASNSTMRTNTATTNGGGLMSNTGSTTTLTNSTFTGNMVGTTAGLGGGLFMTGATLTINGGTFSTNQARNGGAIFVNASTTSNITGTTFTGNTAANHGGGVYVNANTVSISDAIFTSNTAQANGGAIQTTTGTTLNLTNVDVLNNSAVSLGGGLMSDGQFTITGSIFSGNGGGAQAGGIYAANGTSRTVQNSCLNANTATNSRDLSNGGTASLNATSNYWGAATGPAAGQVSANVNTASFLASCPN